MDGDGDGMGGQNRDGRWARRVSSGVEMGQLGRGFGDVLSWAGAGYISGKVLPVSYDPPWSCPTPLGPLGLAPAEEPAQIHMNPQGNIGQQKCSMVRLHLYQWWKIGLGYKWLCLCLWTESKKLTEIHFAQLGMRSFPRMQVCRAHFLSLPLCWGWVFFHLISLRNSSSSRACLIRHLIECLKGKQWLCQLCAKLYYELRKYRGLVTRAYWFTEVLDRGIKRTNSSIQYSGKHWQPEASHGTDASAAWAIASGMLGDNI